LDSILSQSVYNSPDRKKESFAVAKLKTSTQSPGTPKQRSSGMPSSCRDTSVRNLFLQDSLHIGNNSITRTYDGNILISGYRIKSYTPYHQTGSLVKCTPLGDTVWVKTIDNIPREDKLLICTNAFELKDHSILLVSSLYIKLPVGGTHELMLTKLTEQGNFIWQKTFNSTKYPYNQGSQDFDVNDIKSTDNGDIYFCGAVRFDGLPRDALAGKLHADGTLVWSKGFNTGDTPVFSGFNLTGNQMQVFGRLSGEALCIASFDADNGNILMTKKITLPLAYPESFLYNFYLQGVQKLNNGNTILFGRTNTDVGNPVSLTGHWSTLEISPDFKIVKGYIYKNYLQSAYSYTRVNVFADGSVAMAMLYYTPATGSCLYIAKASETQIIRERFIPYYIDGWQWTSNFVQLPDGGAFITNDITAPGANYSRSGIEVVSLHNSDLPSPCTGFDTTMTVVESQDWNISDLTDYNQVDSMLIDSVQILFKPVNDGLSITNECKQISYCDTIKIHGNSKSCTAAIDFTFTAFKNKECNSRVQWTTVLPTQKITYLNDTTVQMRFAGEGQGWLYGEINTRCGLLKDSILITVFASPGQVNLGGDQPLCPANSIILNAHSGYAAYLWNNGTMDSLLTVSSPGKYAVAVTDACGNQFKDTVQVFAAPPIPFSIGADRIKCNADTLQLSAPAGFTNYVWGPNYQIGSINQQQVIVQPLKDTLYYVRAELTTGCFAYDTIKVKVNTSPSIQLGPDVSFCSGDSVIFKAPGGFAAYHWSSGNNSSSLAAYTTGQYDLWATTAAGCKSYDTVSVLNVWAKPQPVLDKSSQLCAGSTRILSAGNFPKYMWQDGSTGPSFSISNTGSYFVTVSDNHQCTGSDTVYVTTLLNPPTAFLPPDTAVCNYATVTIKPREDFYDYKWNNGAATSTVTVSIPGIYWLQVQDMNGCLGRDSILVNPKDCMNGVYFPSAFSPDNNGLNDIYRPLIFGVVKTYRFTIYNRYGQIVFSTTEVNKGWNGSFKGVDQKAGGFTWSCIYQLAGSAIQSEKGSMLLVR
jgi:gliding motility-associated-like protein